jgi:citrate synthase
MLIGKFVEAKTSICTADESSITVWGLDLCNELVGKLSFTEFFFLLTTGRRPTANQTFFVDALLVTIAEHGLTPTAQAARMTLAAAPDALQAAVAAGILGAGTVVLGTTELCGVMLQRAQKLIDGGASIKDAAHDIARDYHRRGERLPGFGHPLHRPVDPRAERLIKLAEEKGVSGKYLDLARAFKPAADEAWGKPLVMNVSVIIAAILLDLDFPAAMIKAIPLLARTAGLLGHLAEEQRQPIGFMLSHHAEEAITYEKPTSTEPKD